MIEAMATDPRVDAYLSALPQASREALQHLREQIRRAVPEAEETISYGMLRAAHGPELEGFGGTKGSVHFTPERPLPDSVIDGLIRARVDDLDRGRTY